jgi:acyl-CoA thioesterase-1
MNGDALSLYPQLIIIQIGTNDATIGPATTDLANFSSRLEALVARLKPAVSVVLMNGQYYPDEPQIYAGYMAAIDRVSRSQGVAVIDRYSLMKRWISSGKYQVSEVLASDRFHPNDFTYRCMGQIAADLIVQSTVK